MKIEENALDKQSKLKDVSSVSHLAMAENLKSQGKGGWRQQRNCGHGHNSGGRSDNNRGRSRSDSSHGNAFSQLNFNNFHQGQFYGQNSNKVHCQICHKYGHNALDCYNRMIYSFQGRHPPTKLAAMATS